MTTNNPLADVLAEMEATGSEYTITRDGEPVAVLLPVDEYDSLVETVNVLSDPDTMDAIAEAQAEEEAR